MLWKFLPGDLAHQAATASSALTCSSAMLLLRTSLRPPASPSSSALRSAVAIAHSTLNTRYRALSRRFIRHMTSVLNLTAQNTDSSGFVVRRCTQSTSLLHHILGLLYVVFDLQMCQFVGWARGARRGTLGEQRVILDCTASSKTPLSPRLWLRTDTRARGPHLQVWSTTA